MFRDFKRNDLRACVRLISQTMGKRSAKKARIDLLAGLGAGREGYAFFERKVVTVNGKVIAIICIYRLNGHPSNVMGVDWIAVSPKYWKRGLGTKLIEWSMAQTRAHRKRFLFAWSVKKAVYFYEKVGFKRSNMNIMKESKRLVLLVKKTN